MVEQQGTLPIAIGGLPIAESGPSTWGHHRDELFCECPRKYKYEFLDKLEPSRIFWPFRTGRSYHAGLAEWYRRMQAKQQESGNISVTMTVEDQQASIDYADLEMKKGLDLDASPSLATEVEIEGVAVDELLTSYFSKYPDESEWRILEVEKEIGVVMGGEVFTFRNDLIVEHMGIRKVMTVDHKGSGQWASVLFKQYQLDDQMTGYVKGLQVAYPELAVDGFIINGLGKVPSAGKKRSGFPWFERENFLRSPADTDRWLRNRQAKRQQIRMCEATGFWPMYTTSCVKWGRECDFLPACKDHEDPAIMESLYRRGQ